jgi:type 1 fimbria pilin
MMLLNSRPAALAAVIAALAGGAASASAATIRGEWIVPSSCAVTNPATGCTPYWTS